jgi:hypothetical protein
MLLTKEIDEIKAAVRNSDKSLLFPAIDTSSDSYYINYKDSIHQDSVLTEYSSEFLDFKKTLSGLWSNSKLNCFSNAVLSSIMQVKDDEESVIEAIQLYNYMM